MQVINLNGKGEVIKDLSQMVIPTESVFYEVIRAIATGKEDKEGA